MVKAISNYAYIIFSFHHQGKLKCYETLITSCYGNLLYNVTNAQKCHLCFTESYCCASKPDQELTAACRERHILNDYILRSVQILSQRGFYYLLCCWSKTYLRSDKRYFSSAFQKVCQLILAWGESKSAPSALRKLWQSRRIILARTVKNTNLKHVENW